jgi:hypothetical protein
MPASGSSRELLPVDFGLTQRNIAIISKNKSFTKENILRNPMLAKKHVICVRYTKKKSSR